MCHNIAPTGLSDAVYRFPESAQHVLMLPTCCLAGQSSSTVQACPVLCAVTSSSSTRTSHCEARVILPGYTHSPPASSSA